MIYSGPLDYRKMPPEVLRAYRIWATQRTRNVVSYTSREFIGWWLEQITKKEWIRPSCGRIDHSRGYSFDNIQMEELKDNVIERNSRHGNPGRSHKAVEAFSMLDGSVLGIFPSKVEAAACWGVSEKTIYNHASGRTTTPFRFGPKTVSVGFRWVK